jgi:hypothetical protein
MFLWGRQKKAREVSDWSVCRIYGLSIASKDGIYAFLVDSELCYCFASQFVPVFRRRRMLCGGGTGRGENDSAETECFNDRANYTCVNKSVVIDVEDTYDTS